MSGSCPVGATVCRDAHAEVERLRRWKDEALPVLDGLQELGKALGIPLGSRITGQEALAAVERLTRERDEARAEAERLRGGIEALAEDPTWHRGMYGSPRDMVSTDRLIASSEGRVSRMQTPEETVSRIMGACLHHLWEGRCVRHHSIIRSDNATCVVAQGAAEFIRARDAEVVAKALRKAAHGLDHTRTYRVSDIKALLYGRADQIEREAGESNADAR